MSTRPVAIFPSLISADLLNLHQEIKTLEPYCQGFHIDVMDFHFVPNLTWGFAFIESIASATNLPLSIHLMVDEPEAFARRLKPRQGDTITFHIEAVTKIIIEYLNKSDAEVGIALKPSTSLEKIYPYLAHVDEVLLMSVEPGSSGQPFINESIARLKELNKYRDQKKLTFKIVMDGGINAQNLPELIANGVDQVAIASAIFAHADRVKAIKNLFIAS